MLFCRAHKQRQKDVNFESRLHVPPRGYRTVVESPSADLFNLPPADRVSYYGTVLSWWASYEVPCILIVPSPSVFTNYRD